MKKINLSKLSLALAAIAFSFTACQNTNSEEVETTVATELSDTTSAEVSVTEEKIEAEVKKTPLTVIVTNLESPDAPVEMSIYGSDPKKFLVKKGQLKKYRFKPVDGKLTMKIKDVPYGEFAMALYQDVNSDGKIDKNMIGIPTEPYAFSNNIKPTIKAPSYKECSFVYNEKTNTVNVTLIKK